MFKDSPSLSLVVLLNSQEDNNSQHNGTRTRKKKTNKGDKDTQHQVKMGGSFKQYVVKKTKASTKSSSKAMGLTRPHASQNKS
ncbi:hypothetical protein QJS10_CPB15g01190 [Acorus calamus]|uniref:Uncharacterized protein n=1 Tax=Acorus calamus TaxID=4465 RepID=A0AAV9D9W3_ACOCL|nr:hypothetical protein QJS10_CPB15g01190 [Acorus calamus]